MIETVNLQKTFGSFQAVRGIDLHVEAGEVVALLGPNGAGKTTTVRMLGAILKPTAGHARVAGLDVVTDARQVRHMVGLLTEFPGLYLRMRSMEYLQFFGELQGMSSALCRSRGEHLLQQFGLWDARDKRIDSYSKGMKQKIALIRALIHDPPVLYLDEPTTAMDPHSARVVRDAIAELRAARRTVLLTTHNLTEAEYLADRIVIIRGGVIIAEGTRTQLTRQLMGEPLWELHIDAPIARALPLLDGLIHAADTGDTWLRYNTAEARSLNPQILQRLMSAGLPVVALAEVPQRLEDVYLSIIADESERGAWTGGHIQGEHEDSQLTAGDAYRATS